MKKHIYNTMIGMGVVIFLFTLFEIIDISWEETWGEGFYGTFYYWILWLSGVFCVTGIFGKLDEIEKKIDLKTDEKTL